MPESPLESSRSGETPTDATLRGRLDALCREGWATWERFEADAADRPFHPFVAANYDVVATTLWHHRNRGLRFLEWGSATGVITIMADLLGYEACGIELDDSLVTTARRLAHQFDSAAVFVAGSFLPQGYRWRPGDGDGRTGTLGSGASGYLRLGRPLDEFDVVFAYPWDGEEPMMRDLMSRYGRPDAVLLLHGASDGVRAWRAGRDVTDTWATTPPGPPGPTR
jgi:hypothetical protein